MRLHCLCFCCFLFVAGAAIAQKKASPKKKPAVAAAKASAPKVKEKARQTGPPFKEEILKASDTTTKKTVVPPDAVKEKASPTSVREAQMLEELNAVRSHPKEYAVFVQAYVTNHLSDTGIRRAGIELIMLLDTLRPQRMLVFSDYLYQQAKVHAQWMEDADLFEHSEFSNGENLVAGIASVREAVVVLLVDARRPDRGHRLNILNPAYKFAGIAEAAGTVQGMQHAFVQEFNFKR